MSATGLPRTRLGRYIRRARLARKLNPHQLARRLGYSERGSSKGARRILTLETTGLEDPAFIQPVLRSLNLNTRIAARHAERDEWRRREEWERWADEPIRPALVVRYFGNAFGHVTYPLPEDAGTSHERAIQWSGEVLRTATAERERPITGRLILSRRLWLWLNERGEVIIATVVTYEGPPKVSAARSLQLIAENGAVSLSRNGG